jgi:hypothetical protein
MFFNKMESIKYWYISRHPETHEVLFNINLPHPEKDIVFTEDSFGGWILQTSDQNKYLLTWENNYRAMHEVACFCEGTCIFVREEKMIDNIFLSREETRSILAKLCEDNKQ